MPDSGYVIKLPDTSMALQMVLMDDHIFVLVRKSDFNRRDTLILYKIKKNGVLESKYFFHGDSNTMSPYNLRKLDSSKILLTYRIRGGANMADTIIIIDKNGGLLNERSARLISRNIFIYRDHFLVNSWDQPGGTALLKSYDSNDLTLLGEINLPDSLIEIINPEGDMNYQGHFIIGSIVWRALGEDYYKFFLFDSIGNVLKGSKLHINIGRSKTPYFNNGWLCYDKGLLLLDNNLDSVWGRTIDDYWYEGFNEMKTTDIVPCRDSTFIVGGLLKNNFQNAPYWIKLDKNGGIIYKHLVRMANVDYMIDMAPAEDGGIYMLQGHHQNGTVFLVKTDSNGLISGVQVSGIDEEREDAIIGMQLIPNPGTEDVCVSWTGNGQGIIHVVNLTSGQRMVSDENQNLGSHCIKTSSLGTGHYQICVVTPYFKDCKIWIKR